MPVPELELGSWRRAVAELYASVRAEAEPASAHALWREGRDELFRTHPQSPLLAEDPMRRTGLPYWPYDPALRFDAELERCDAATDSGTRAKLVIPTTSDGTISLRRIGRLILGAPLDATLDAWWLDQYAGGLFVPLRDATAGRETYGGGRYLLDTAKGADLGGSGTRVVVDLNFVYHPSCRYNPRWECPLAPTGNRLALEVRAGERLEMSANGG